MTNGSYLIRSMVDIGVPIHSICLETGVKEQLVKQVIRGQPHNFRFKAFKNILGLWCRVNNFKDDHERIDSRD